VSSWRRSSSQARSAAGRSNRSAKTRLGDRLDPVDGAVVGKRVEERRGVARDHVRHAARDRRAGERPGERAADAAMILGPEVHEQALLEALERAPGAERTLVVVPAAGVDVGAAALPVLEDRRHVVVAGQQPRPLAEGVDRVLIAEGAERGVERAREPGIAQVDPGLDRRHQSPMPCWMNSLVNRSAGVSPAFTLMFSFL
jgi:hypothetical protein